MGVSEYLMLSVLFGSVLVWGRMAKLSLPDYDALLLSKR
jgi:hypothetical protein